MIAGISTCVLVLPKTNVCPSGLERATSVAPITPPPTAFVLCHNRAQRRFHLLGPQPRSDIGRAAWGERDDQPDRTVGIGKRGNGQRSNRCDSKSTFEELATSEQFLRHRLSIVLET